MIDKYGYTITNIEKWIDPATHEMTGYENVCGGRDKFIKDFPEKSEQMYRLKQELRRTENEDDFKRKILFLRYFPEKKRLFAFNWHEEWKK